MHSLREEVSSIETHERQVKTGPPEPATHPSSRRQELSEGQHTPVHHKSVVRRALNRILHLFCRYLPGARTLRPFLHRVRGMQIGRNVWIGDDVYLENEYPELVEIHDGAVVGLRTIIIAHTRGAGRIVIGKDVYIGAATVIVTAANRTLVIGEGSVIMASSLVTGNVPPYTLYGSDASKPLARITKPFTATANYEDFMMSLRPLPR